MKIYKVVYGHNTIKTALSETVAVGTARMYQDKNNVSCVQIYSTLQGSTDWKIDKRAMTLLQKCYWK